MGINDFCSTLLYEEAAAAAAGFESTTMAAAADAHILKNYKKSGVPRFQYKKITTANNTETNNNAKNNNDNNNRKKENLIECNNVRDEARLCGADDVVNVKKLKKSTNLKKKASSSGASVTAPTTTTTSSSLPVPISVTPTIDMDFYRAASGAVAASGVGGVGGGGGGGSAAGSLRKKSSFLWNSFRIPRKQRAANANVTDASKAPSRSGPEAGSGLVAIKEDGLRLQSGSVQNGVPQEPMDAAGVQEPALLPAQEQKLQSKEQSLKSASNQQQLANQNCAKKSSGGLMGKFSSKKSHFSKHAQPGVSIDDEKSRRQHLHGELAANVKLLKDYVSADGTLDSALLERHLNDMNHRIEGLAVVVKYMADDLNAFTCPILKQEKDETKEELMRTQETLEEVRQSCKQYEEKLNEAEAYCSQREEELTALRREEIGKLTTDYEHMHELYKERIMHMERELQATNKQHKSDLDSLRQDVSAKLKQKAELLATAEETVFKLQQRVQQHERTEQELREKLTSTENACAGRLKAATAREHDLNEHINALTQELSELRASKESSERRLREKLNLSHDEVAVLRPTTPAARKTLNDSGLSALRHSTSSASPTSSATASAAELSRLQNEAESLRCVLELKQAEIAKLSKSNEEMKRESAEKSSLNAKLSMLEGRVEMLNSELSIKNEREKELQRQIEEIQKAYSHESLKLKRVRCDKEQLQWQLKNRSEQLQLVGRQTCATCSASITGTTAALLDTSFSPGHRSTLSISAGQQHNSTQIMGSPVAGSRSSLSPPPSPIVKAVIEKSDSVSWVLEMDDETPEEAASKLVKRAGSMRSSCACGSPGQTQKRHTTHNSSGHNYHNSSSTSNISSNGGSIPLSQSMSATSVQHSNSTERDAATAVTPAHRVRSQSVCLKHNERSFGRSAPNTPGSRSSQKLSRQLSNGSAASKFETTAAVKRDWLSKPLQTSSPKLRVAADKAIRTASDVDSKHNIESHIEDEIEVDELFSRQNAAAGAVSQCQQLITCDTSTLNSGERLNMRSALSSASVQDLKELKKFQRIKESAGEAMVSANNSEDDIRSALSSSSSDDIASSASAGSAATGEHSSESARQQDSHMSYEDMLILEHGSSLNGTPMDVSWSDDMDAYGSSNA